MSDTPKDDVEQPGHTPSGSPANVAETMKGGQREKSATPGSLPGSVNGNPNATPNAGTSGANSPPGNGV